MLLARVRMGILVLLACCLLTVNPATATPDITEQDGQVRVGLAAPWPSTPRHPFMEVAEFLTELDTNFFWAYMHQVSNQDPEQKQAAGQPEQDETWESISIIASRGAARILEQEGEDASLALLRLLDLDLGMRAFTPAIEQQRVLGERLWTEFATTTDTTSDIPLVERCAPARAWVALERADGLGSLLFCDANKLASYLNGDKSIVAEASLSQSVEVYSGADHVRIGAPQASTGSSGQSESEQQQVASVIVLHGVPSTDSFTELYRIVSTTVGSDATLAVRFMPHVLSQGAEPSLHVLGFGATLDVKNMEYITVDTDGDDKSKPIETGTTTGETNDTHRSDERVVLLPGSEGEQAQWDELVDRGGRSLEPLTETELVNLGLQATTAIMSASDPLKRLIDIAHNFPMRAKPLSKVQVDVELAFQVEQAMHRFRSLNGIVTVNGMVIAGDPGKSTGPLNVFSLLEAVQRELRFQVLVNRLGLDQRAANELFGDGMGSDENETDNSTEQTSPLKRGGVRVNLRTGAKGAIVFVNNVEKDAMYKDWPRKIRTLLVSSGSLTPVRKNLYTAIVFVDPTEPMSRDVVSKLIYFISVGVPVRFGFVFTSRELVKEAKMQLENGITAEDAAGLDKYALVGNTDEPLGEGFEVDNSAACGVVCFVKLYSFVRKSGGSTGGVTFLQAYTQRDPRSQGVTPPPSREQACLLAAKVIVQTGKSRSVGAVFADAQKALLSTVGLVNVFKMAQYVAAKGVPVPSWSLNGRVFTDVTGIDRQLQEQLGPEQAFITDEIRARRLTGDKTDVFKYILKQTGALDQFSAIVMRPQDEMVYTPVPLPQSDLIYASLSSTLTKEPLETLTRRVGYLFTGAEAHRHRPCVVSLWVLADVTSVGGLEMIHSALDIAKGELSAAIDSLLSDEEPKQTHHSPMRIAFLPAGHKQRGRGGGLSAHSALAASAWRLWAALDATVTMAWGDQSDSQQLIGIEALLAAVAVALDAAKAKSVTNEWATNETIEAIVKAAAQSIASSNESTPTWLEKFSSTLSLPSHAVHEHVDRTAELVFDVLVRSEAVPARENEEPLQGVFSNGRLLMGVLQRADLDVLVRYERNGNAERVVKHLGLDGGKEDENKKSPILCENNEGSGDVDGEAVLESVYMSACMRAVSDKVMAAASLVGVRSKTERVDLRASYFEHLDRLIHVFEGSSNVVGRTGDGGSRDLDVKIILDPLSDAAQRIAPVGRMLRDALNAKVTLVLLPRQATTELPLTNFYRSVIRTSSSSETSGSVYALFDNMPQHQLLTLKLATPQPWIVYALETGGLDTDNIHINKATRAYAETETETTDMNTNDAHIHDISYELKYLLVAGKLLDVTEGQPPAGMQLELFPAPVLVDAKEKEENICDETTEETCAVDIEQLEYHSSRGNKTADTLVMRNFGYWQMRASPGVWDVVLAPGASSDIYQVLDTDGVPRTQLPSSSDDAVRFNKLERGLRVLCSSFTGAEDVPVRVAKRPGKETAKLLDALQSSHVTSGNTGFNNGALAGLWGQLKGAVQGLTGNSADVGSVAVQNKGIEGTGEEGSLETIHVFSVASGALYERFLRIMMVSVRSSTSGPVKFWLIENFLSPSFKASIGRLAAKYNFSYALVTYKWPEWLRAQTEKQRIIWGYKILFLDVLFPLDVPKIIYVDADQVVRADLRELWTMDLQGAPYGYTPFCDSRHETLGFQFWRKGYWKDHLKGRPYHISALYVVDLIRFRRELVGDQLRAVYDMLSRDPASLSNLDQDLPNYAQRSIKIFSLPQEWLWCESWCSDASKHASKTIDLCNNPLHKEPKLDMAKRIISGDLFEKSWVELDAEIKEALLE